MTSDDAVQSAVAAVVDRGYCVLPGHLESTVVETCRAAFWPHLLTYLAADPAPNRGPGRHYVAMPFEASCFAPEFFFDPVILDVVRRLMDDRIVADQWGCDVPVRGSAYQTAHADYQRPLFPERADLLLPPFAIVVSFGLVPITRESGPIEIAPGTQRMTRGEATRAVEAGDIPLEAVTLGVGDILIRHPWALHRGTPNSTDVPRAMASIRYARRWYSDDSREVASIPHGVWRSLTAEQQRLLRFPIGA